MHDDLQPGSPASTPASSPGPSPWRCSFPPAKRSLTVTAVTGITATGHGRHGHGAPVRHVVAPRVLAAPSGFLVPPRLTPAFVYSSRPYLAGDFYYGPHRHRHVVYSFPVVVGGAVAYRPHVYCGGALVRDAWIPDDDGWLRIGLNVPGLSIAANLPLHD